MNKEYYLASHISKLDGLLLANFLYCSNAYSRTVYNAICNMISNGKIFFFIIKGEGDGFYDLVNLNYCNYTDFAWINMHHIIFHYDEVSSDSKAINRMLNSLWRYGIKRCYNVFEINIINNFRYVLSYNKQEEC